MIVDSVVGVLVTFVEWVAGLLPDHEFAPPSPVAIMQTVLDIDSLVPILGPLSMAGGLLALGVVFVVVRLVLLVRHVLLP